MARPIGLKTPHHCLHLVRSTILLCEHRCVVNASWSASPQRSERSWVRKRRSKCHRLDNSERASTPEKESSDVFPLFCHRILTCFICFRFCRPSLLEATASRLEAIARHGPRSPALLFGRSDAPFPLVSPTLARHAHRLETIAPAVAKRLGRSDALCSLRSDARNAPFVASLLRS